MDVATAKKEREKESRVPENCFSAPAVRVYMTAPSKILPRARPPQLRLALGARIEWRDGTRVIPWEDDDHHRYAWLIEIESSSPFRVAGLPGAWPRVRVLGSVMGIVGRQSSACVSHLRLSVNSGTGF